ncbi:tRNA cyclic N6-threonylcarbamoyladenosine(37) synthase TcdA [Pleionea sediminis]|uniref:tRNA cyclic N6-threonylcarbamoyladenosine(37) synthase TcdA n=1 Tax=Pleionea sediminis TaxID=2569479 RepID=UPI0011872826|nr:tRNA cyclic N6-threonylcarbamoyladenosine(37) synthase TcdA [Pleionea sediminis]
MSDFDFRFGGLKRLYGNKAVDGFRQAHVCVIGIGGVGSWVAESLARSAIGKITLIDLDDICTSNINRQIHALDPTVGKMKVSVMKERILQINPECEVICIEDFITKDNLEQYIFTDMDFVVDAIDSVKAKAAVIAFCKRNKIPIITVGGAGGQQDPTQVKVSDLNRTKHDPLAAKVRSDLRRFYNFSRNPKRRYSVDCVYSEEQQVYPKPDGTVCQSKSFNEGSTRLDCASGFGATTVVTATFGFVATARVLEKLKRKFEN